MNPPYKHFTDQLEFKQAAPEQDSPGRSLDIVGLIVVIFANLIGPTISAIAPNQSKKAGFKNTPALAGVVVGAILSVLGIIIDIAAGLFAPTMITC